MRNRVGAYGVALAALAGAVTLRWLLDPILGDQLPLVLLFGAVAVASWYGGYRPAVLIAVIGFVVCYFLFFERRSDLTTAFFFVTLIAYVFICIIIIAFGEAMLVARRRFEALAQQRERPAPLTSTDVELIRQKYNLRTVVFIGFALTLAVLILGDVLGYASAQRLAENDRNVAHSYEVTGALETLLSTLKDAETGQRGYLLAEDPKYLEPYEDAIGKVNAQVVHLQELSADNPDRQAHLTVLAQKIISCLDELQQTVALMKNKEREAALNVVRTGTGKALMDDVRQIIAGMQQTEHDLLQRRAEESRASYFTTVLSIILPTLIGIVLVGIVFYLNQRIINQRQRAAEVLAGQRERLRVTLASVIDGIITIDERGVVQSFNPAAERLFGYQASEVIGQNVRTLMPDPYRHEHDDYIGNYLRTGKAKIIGIGREVEGKRKDGSTFPMDLAVSEFRVGMRRHFTGIVRDITERKRSEEALKKADRQKDEFLAMLAHELRNPLAPLSNMLEIVKRTGGTPSQTHPYQEGEGGILQAVRGTMERQLGQLVRLVDDLIDISRINHNKIELRKTRVELASIILQSVEACRPLAEGAKHELVVRLLREPVYLDADPIRLAQVFGNLLNNGCKYTEPGGRIEIVAERQGSDAVVKVKDNGVGIPADELGIFSKCSRRWTGLWRARKADWALA